MTSPAETPLKKSHNSDTFDSFEYEENSVLQRFAKYVYKSDPQEPLPSAEKFCQKIVHWAAEHEVDHYSFLSFPRNSAACEKQESLIDLKYTFERTLVGEPRIHLPTDLLLKGEADGSSFPSGGLRHTHRARAYNVWDRANEVFIRRKNKVMYIPAMLIAHNGEALDDMAIYRKSETVMKETASALLHALGV
jgi:glutamine synthetase